jgi:hypothetical protein
MSVSAPASAATPAKPPSISASLTGQAKKDFIEGVALAKDGKHQHALAKFGHAYEASKDPRILFNLSAEFAAIGRHIEARDTMRQFKQQAAAAALLTPQDQVEADRFIGAFDSLIGRMRIEVDQPGATVSLDGRELGATPLPDVDAEEGEHEVRVTLDGYRDWTSKVAVRGNGAETQVTATLTKRAGRLVIKPNPPRAIVRIDGKPTLGLSDAPIAPGPHHVVVSCEGMIPREFDATVVDGETRLFDVSLTREPPRPKEPKSAMWAWITGGWVVAVGIVAGAIVLTREHQQETPAGNVGTVTVP